jgi:hypothetical protein
MSVTTTSVEFDPLSEEFFNDPTEMYRRLKVDEAGLRRVQMANVTGYSNAPVRAVPQG